MSWQRLNEKLILEYEGCGGHDIEARRLCRSFFLFPPPPDPWWLLFQTPVREYTTAPVQCGMLENRMLEGGKIMIVPHGAVLL